MCMSTSSTLTIDCISTVIRSLLNRSEWVGLELFHFLPYWCHHHLSSPHCFHCRYILVSSNVSTSSAAARGPVFIDVVSYVTHWFPQPSSFVPVLSPQIDFGLRHQQEDRWGGRHHPYQAFEEQDCRIHHPLDEGTYGIRVHINRCICESIRVWVLSCEWFVMLCGYICI